MYANVQRAMNADMQRYGWILQSIVNRYKFFFSYHRE